MKCEKTTSGIGNYLKYKRSEQERGDKEIAEAFILVVGEMVRHGTMWPKGISIPDGPFQGKIMP